MSFDQVVRASAVDVCVERIQQEILGGRLRPGERLPPERELSVQLGVARLTLRAALARVAASGLIEARHGVGHVVQDVVRRGSPQLMGTLARAADAGGELPKIAGDLLAIRRGLARTVLERLVATTPDAAHVRALDAAIDAFEATVQRGASTTVFAEADLDVVVALINASGMTVAALFLNPVFAALRELPALRDAIYADPMDNVVRWRGVAQWLRVKKRDAAPLLASIEEHDARTVTKLKRAKK